MVKVMVCGFMFCGQSVLLVRKLKPAWQRDLYNGVGGKVEDGETPIAGMVREFLEETGVQTLPGDWRHFAVEQEPSGVWVHFFAARVDYATRQRNRWPARNDAGEVLSWLPWDSVVSAASRSLNDGLPANVAVVNLAWLLPLALDPRDVPAIVVQPRVEISEMPR